MDSSILSSYISLFEKSPVLSVENRDLVLTEGVLNRYNKNKGCVIGNMEIENKKIDIVSLIESRDKRN